MQSEGMVLGLIRGFPPLPHGFAQDQPVGSAPSARAVDVIPSWCPTARPLGCRAARRRGLPPSRPSPPRPSRSRTRLEPVPDAAVPQDEVRDDAGAVVESDQGEQGFVSVGLCGYAGVMPRRRNHRLARSRTRPCLGSTNSSSGSGSCALCRGGSARTRTRGVRATVRARRVAGIREGKAATARSASPSSRIARAAAASPVRTEICTWGWASRRGASRSGSRLWQAVTEANTVGRR